RCGLVIGVCRLGLCRCGQRAQFIDQPFAGGFVFQQIGQRRVGGRRGGSGGGRILFSGRRGLCRCGEDAVRQRQPQQQGGAAKQEIRRKKSVDAEPERGGNREGDAIHGRDGRDRACKVDYLHR